MVVESFLKTKLDAVGCLWMALLLRVGRLPVEGGGCLHHAERQNC